MLPNTAGRVLGLIAIEVLPPGQVVGPRGQAAAGDETISLAFARLARPKALVGDAAECPVLHCLGDLASARFNPPLAARPPSRLVPPACLAADLGNLTAELQAAAAAVRQMAAESSR